MFAVKRRLYSATIALLALAPASALAASPSPGLDTVLTAAPAGYTAPITSEFNGHMTANQFSQSWTNSNRSVTELNNDGFVDAYGRAVGDPGSGRIMVEFVIAFGGQSGALRFMGIDHVESTADPAYQHEDSAGGLGPYYYGFHGAQSSPALAVDAFEFVKGNDMFGVGFFSSRDDVLALAVAQAKKQYEAAPASTISPNDWPENQAPPGTGSGFAGLGQGVIIGIVVIGALVVAAAFFVMRRNEGRSTKPAVTQEMTADGNFWWNGTAWIATTDYAPPWAQRSPDGAFWWDGQRWRPMPAAQMPVGQQPVPR